MNQSRYLNTKQLVELLQIKESHVRALVFRREIPFKKVGKLVRFDRNEIERWLEEKRVS